MNWYKMSQVGESKPIWQTTKEDFAGPYPKLRDLGEGEKYSEEDFGPHNEWRKKERAYNSQMQKAVAEGKISPEEAEKMGARFEMRKEKLKPLPSILYHTTTSKDKVISEGLKTREELSMSFGAGLGGGTSETISFTTDINIAINIKRAILEAKNVSSGDLDIPKMIEMARKGDGAKKPWIKEVLDYYRNQDSEYDKERIVENGIPMQIQLLMNKEIRNSFFFLKGDEEKLKSEGWYHDPEDDSPHIIRRKLSNEEYVDRVFSFFKVWSAYREKFGGPEDPLFFTSDVLGLSKIPNDQIAVLEFKAKPGSVGYQEMALGEWRTWSGSSVEFVRIVA